MNAPGNYAIGVGTTCAINNVNMLPNMKQPAIRLRML